MLPRPPLWWYVGRVLIDLNLILRVFSGSPIIFRCILIAQGCSVNSWSLSLLCCTCPSPSFIPEIGERLINELRKRCSFHSRMLSRFVQRTMKVVLRFHLMQYYSDWTSGSIVSVGFNLTRPRFVTAGCFLPIGVLKLTIFFSVWKVLSDC